MFVHKEEDRTDIKMNYCPECGGKLLGSEKFCSHCAAPLKETVFLEKHDCINCSRKFQGLDIDSIRKAKKILFQYLPEEAFYYCPQCYSTYYRRGLTLVKDLEILIEHEYRLSKSEIAFLKKSLRALKHT